MWVLLEYDPIKPELSHQGEWYIAVNIENSNALLVRRMQGKFHLELEKTTSAVYTNGGYRPHRSFLNKYSDYEKAVKAAENLLSNIKSDRNICQITPSS